MAVGIVGAIGRVTIGVVTGTVNLSVLLYLALKSPFAEGWRGSRLVVKIFLQQVYFTAVQAMAYNALIAISVGAVVMVQAGTILPRYGMVQDLEPIISVVTLRELGPLLIALIVVARSGTAIATEIGNMRVNREIDALDAMGVNTDYLIVLPRILGMIVSMGLLNLTFGVFAILGGHVIASAVGALPTHVVLSEVFRAVHLDLIAVSFIKVFLFGSVIVLANCHQGLRVRSSPTEVPQRATRGAIVSIGACMVLNLLVSIHG